MADLLFFAVNGLQWIIIGDALLSWMMPAEQFPRSLTGSITDPLYAPIRAILNPQKTGGIDLSPIVMLLLLNVMESMLRSAMH